MTIIKAQELRSLGFHQEYIRQLEQQGLITRVARGVYMLPNIDLTENQSLVEASVRVSKGVICLLSALRFHDLTTQAPFEVWMAIASKTRSPSEAFIPLRMVYMSEDSLLLSSK